MLGIFMDKVINVGLIGLGAMGVKHFGIYKSLPNVNVCAIADMDLARLKGDISTVRLNGRRIAEDSIDLTGVKVFANANELIEQMPNLDMIDICLPTTLHPKLIRDGLKAKLAVFCEKPLCLSFDEADGLLAEIEESKLPFNLGLCVRMNPPFLHAYQYIKSGKAGKIHSAIFRRFSPRLKGWFVSEEKTGGALLDLHIHDVDFINFLFGCPDAVTASGITNTLSENSGIDQVTAMFHYNDGPMVVAEGGWAASCDVPFERNFLIIGERATLQFNHDEYKIYPADGGVEEVDLSSFEYPDGWHMELKYFTDCLKKGVAPYDYQTLESIANTYRILKAEKDAVLSNQKVAIDKIG
jgi:predicted dehydrogenase